MQRKLVDIIPVFELYLSKLREKGYHDQPKIIVLPVFAYAPCDDSGTGVN